MALAAVDAEAEAVMHRYRRGCDDDVRLFDLIVEVCRSAHRAGSAAILRADSPQAVEAAMRNALITLRNI